MVPVTQPVPGFQKVGSSARKTATRRNNKGEETGESLFPVSSRFFPLLFFIIRAHRKLLRAAFQYLNIWNKMFIYNQCMHIL